MAILEVTEEEAQAIWHENTEGWESLPLRDGWRALDHKRQCCTRVVKRLSDGKHFEISASRQGSYQTDWDYEYITSLDEVELREVTVVTKQWVAVGENN